MRRVFEKSPLVCRLFHDASLFLDDFAEGDAAEATHDDVLAEPGDMVFHIFADGLIRIFDERLLEQAQFGKIFA